MKKKPRIGAYRDGLFRLLSSLALWLAAALPGQAHEVMPAVADLTLDGDTATLEITLNAEAMLAGIDLAELADTDESSRADHYDRVRALPPAELEAAFRSHWTELSASVRLLADDRPVELQLESVVVPDVPDDRIPRDTRIRAEGELPQFATVVKFGWARELGTLVLRQQGVEDGYTGYLVNGQLSPEIPREGIRRLGFWETFGSYIPVGFDHIVPKGLDHILFVLGLFFLAPRIRPLLIQVSVFTLAHTASLALGALGWISVSPAVVEPLIALSIVYVAVENIVLKDLSAWRPVVIFMFGLLHGLGFASVLEEFGLPASQFAAGLIGFNVGVELGQLTVLGGAFLAVGLWFREKSWYRPAIAVPASLAVAATGAWWCVERVFL